MEQQPFAIDYSQAKAYALRRLALGATTAERLRTQLLRRGACSADAEKIIEECLREGYLSDNDYAASLIRHEIARGYGPYAISAKLISRGIDAEMAKELLQKAYPPEDQMEALRLLLQKPRYMALPRMKLLATLARRGFSHSMLQRLSDLET